jgi:hypothetical protein
LKCEKSNALRNNVGRFSDEFVGRLLVCFGTIKSAEPLIDGNQELAEDRHEERDVGSLVIVRSCIAV